MAVGVVLAIAAACSDSETSEQGAAPSTTSENGFSTTTLPTTSGFEDTTRTTAPPPMTTAEEMLTHGQFVAALDRMCRRDNRIIDRYNKRYAAAVARDDYAGAADILRNARRRLNKAFYREAEALDVAPQDARSLGRYLALTRQIETLGIRVERALRRRDDEELSRLDGLIDRLADRRTLVTAGMGLTVCGS
jgi:hypothetical protein